MTSKQLGTVIQRAISDGAFRRQLQSDPTSALRGFDLTSDEVAAIRGGDPTKLSSLGVDQRLSKTFALGDALSSVSRSSTVGDLNTSGSTALPDGGAAGGQNALIDGGRADGQALISDGNAGGAHDGIVGDPTNSRLVLDDNRADGQAAVSDGNSDGIAHDAMRGTDTAGTRTVNDSEPVDTGTYVNGGASDGTRAVHDDAPFDTGTLAASSDSGDRYGDAFISADEAGRYGIAGHTDATLTADSGSDGLDQSSIDSGSVDSTDAHHTGDALGGAGGGHTLS